MELEDLGFNRHLNQFREAHQLSSREIGRITAEHKERYVVRTIEGELEAEITGNMRFTATGREDFPAVGDWVALTVYESRFAIIHTLFPRFSIIKRQANGQFGEVQIIATNIDYAFLVQAADRDFNINRLERYLTICNASRVSPIIVLSKIDLIPTEQVADMVEQIKSRIKEVPVLAISNESGDGYKALSATLEAGKTYCMLGSSGVGKSTLVNNLAGKALMVTDAISLSTHKGRHVTSHRELVILEQGGILIDNPGMREVGIADVTSGLETTFETIVNLSRFCRFKDCTHTTEVGCSVLEALENGEIEVASYENYLKLEREKVHFQSTVAEKRKKDKAFGKMVKDYKKRMK
jgi:ribosome biogenesis GTPase / thiamine phosphate phosphatase